MADNDKKKVLYDQLIKDGYELGDYDSFSLNLNDETKRKNLYDAVNKDGYDIGDYDTFSAKLIGGAQKVLGNKNSISVAVLEEKPQSTLSPYVRGKGGDTEIFGVPYETYTHMKPESQSYYYEQARKKRDEGLKDVAKGIAKNQLGDLRSSIDQELEKEHPSVQAPAGASFIPGVAYGAAQRYGNTNTQKNQDRYTSLVAAKNLLDEADDIVNESLKKGDTNFVGGLARGLRDKGFDVDTWSMGINDAAYGSLLKKAAQKADKGEALSPEEEKLLEAAAVNMATQAYFSSDLGRGYKAGGTTAQSIPFMLEFALNPVSASGSAIAKGILKFGAKRFGLKALGSAATRNSLKVGSRLAGDAVAAAGMTATTGVGRVGAGAQERMIGDVEFDFNKDGKIEYAGRENQMEALEAFGKATASTTIENFSEMAFNAFGGGAEIVGDAIGKITPKGVNEFFAYASKMKPVQLYKELKNNSMLREVAQRTQFHGIFEEHLEEVVGNLMHIPLGEMTLEQTVDLDNNIDILTGLAPTSIAFGALGLGGMSVQSYRTRKNIERLGNSMTLEQKAVLDDVVLKSKGDEKVKNSIRNIVLNRELSESQKKNGIAYLYNRLQEKSAESVRNTETDEAIEKETEEIVNNSDPSTETLTECNRIVLNSIGEPELVPGHIVGHIGDAPVWQAVGSNERITLKEGEYDPASIQSMSTKDMIDATAEMMREEAQKKAEREAKYSPEIIPPTGGVTFSDSEGRSYTIVQPNPDGGWITEVTSMDEKGNPSVRTVDISDEEYYDVIQAQLDAREESANIQPEVNEVSENPLGNEGIALVDESTMTSNEVDSKPSVTVPTVIYKKDKVGNNTDEVDFENMSVENSINYLNDLTKNPESTYKAVTKTLNKASDILASAQKKVAKIEADGVDYTDKKEIGAYAKAKEELVNAQRKVDYWNSVNEEIAASRVQPGDKTAEAILSMGEPMNGEELAAMMLGTGRLPILYDSYKKETGGRNVEARGMVGLFASKANGGMSIEEAGEQLMLADQEHGTHFFDSNDPNAGRNAIIDILSSARTRGDLFSFIQRNREVMAERERQAELEAYELTISKLAEAARMTPEEFIAFEENIAQMLEERLKDVSDEELEGIFAELYLEENERSRESNEVGTGVPEGEERVGSNEGSSGILSEEWADDARASERSAEQPNGNVETGEPGNSVLPEAATVAGRADVELLSFLSPTQMEEESILDYAARVDESKRVHDAGKVVDTNPTEAQKEAGNYKKGHVKIDGFDITIENPKGTVRSGVDADGKPWSITMNNTYGYIRGTEGVDGDHIDVFLGDGGSNVYIVDQVNQDGSFDEHKVMYGFNSEEEARDAYLANYSSGWNGLGTITGVSKELFKEWIDASKRKIKPFNEYKSIQNGMLNEVPQIIEQTETDNTGIFTVEDVNVLMNNPLTVDEIEGSAVESELKTMAKDYLAGNKSFINLVAYQNIYNDVRNRARDIEPNSTDSSETQLDEIINGDQGGLESGFSRGEVDNVDTDGVYAYGRSGMTLFSQRFDSESMANIPNEYARMHHWIEANGTADMGNRAKERVEVYVTGMKTLRNLTGKTHEQLMEGRESGTNILPVDSATVIGITSEQQRSGDKYSYKEDRNTKTGEVMHLAIPLSKDLDRELYLQMVACAKRNDGYWNRFKKAFHFQTKEGADEFIKESATIGEDGNVRFRLLDIEGVNGNPAVERAEIVSEVEALSDSLHAPVRIVKSVDELTESDSARKRIEKGNRVKGWFDTKSQEVVVYLPHAVSVEDANETVLHEVVGHYGLRKMFGEDFDTFLDNVYANASTEVRKGIVDRANRKGNILDLREATEEYLAELAERGFENAEERSLWQKIKDAFVELLRKAGVELSFELTDNELRYILWKSYQNLESPSIMDRAADVDMQNRLGVGEYALKKVDKTLNTNEEFLSLRESKIENDNEISESISQGEYGKMSEKNSRIEEVASELRRRSSEDARNASPNSEGLSERQQKEVENKAMEEYAKEKGIWIPMQDIFSLGVPAPSGNENDVYLDTKDNSVYKVNNLMNSKKISALLERLKLHNQYFPQTKYELVGFSGFGSGDVFPVLKQDYIVNTTYATLEEIDSYMQSLGFNQSGEAAYYNGDVVISDLRPRNVLKDIDGDIYVVDADFREITPDGDKRFRTGESTDEERESDGTIEAYETALKKQGFRAQEAFQDSTLALKVFQDVVLAKDGSKLKSFEDSYKAENRMSSVSTREKEVFSKVFLNPIITEVARLIKEEDATYRDITGYLIAKHGLERNIVLRERKASEVADKAVKESIGSATREQRKGHISEDEYNSVINEANLKRNEVYQKELEKNANKDYSGLTGLMENFADENDSDFTAFAEQFVSDFESKHNTKDLWKFINKATNQTLKKSYESGLMSLEQYDSLKGRFKNYVPLRGWDETMADEVYEYLDNMRSPVNSLLKSADGRKSLADDPIATIGNMADSTILQGNRNIMKQNFLNFVINHPSDLAQVKDVWYVKDNVSGDFVPSFPNIPENATAEDVANIVSEHEENMKFLEKDGLAMRGKNGLELSYKILPYQKSEHIVSMKRNGKDVVVYINGNPRVAQALNGLTNPDVESNAMLSGLGKLNRILASNFTTRNPAFVLSNLSRDLIFSTSAVAVKETPLYLARFSTNIPKSIAAVIKGIRGNGGTSEADKYFQEFLDNGGETGYANLTNVDKYKKMIQKEIKHLTKKDYFKLVRQGLELFEDFNRMAEDVARFNTYMTSRQEGRSIVEAINDAKEITVNFNKKGAGAKSVNKLEPLYTFGNLAAYSAGIFKNLYLFFNAGIQSLFNFNSLYKKNWKNFGGLLGGFTAAGFLTPLVNSLLQSLGGDGDDEDYYANLSEWTRRNNLCLYIPGSKGHFITIPLPIELRAFYGLGDMAYQQTIGNGGKKGTEIAYDAVNQLTELLPLNPLGNNGDLGATLMPDAAKPIWQVMKNEDFTGRPIYKKNSFNEDMPEWTKTYKGASKWLTELSEWSNELGGGDKYKTAPDFLNWNPAVVEHVLQGYFGGMATTLNQLGKTMAAGVESVADGQKSEDLTWRNAPVLSRFINDASDERSAFRGINEKYYQLYDVYKEVDKNLHGYSKEVSSGNLDYLDKLNGLYQSEDYKTYEIFKRSKNQIDRLRKLESELSDAMGDAKDKLQAEIKKLKKEIVEKVK